MSLLDAAGTCRVIEIQRDYVADPNVNADAASTAVEIRPFILRVGSKNLSALVDTQLTALLSATAEPTLAAGSDQLGGADVFTANHCLTIGERL